MRVYWVLHVLLWGSCGHTEFEFFTLKWCSIVLNFFWFMYGCQVILLSSYARNMTTWVSLLYRLWKPDEWIVALIEEHVVMSWWTNFRSMLPSTVYDTHNLCTMIHLILNLLYVVTYHYKCLQAQILSSAFIKIYSIVCVNMFSAGFDVYVYWDCVREV